MLFAQDNDFQRKTTAASVLGGDYNIAPFVNMTVLKDEIKDNTDIEGAYPRWITLAKISNPRNYSAGESGSFVTYGVNLA